MSPGSSCILFFLEHQLKFRHLFCHVLPHFQRGPTVHPTIDLRVPLLPSELGAVCGVKQYNCATLTGNNIRVACHPAVAHYHPHNHQGQRVALQKTVYEPSQYSHSQNLSQTISTITDSHWFILCSKSCVVMPSVLTFLIPGVLHRFSINTPQIIKEVLTISTLDIVPRNHRPSES